MEGYKESHSNCGDRLQIKKGVNLLLMHLQCKGRKFINMTMILQIFFAFLVCDYTPKYSFGPVINNSFKIAYQILSMELL